jgi:hypothetical protein
MAAYERGKVHATNERSKEGMMRDFSFHSRGFLIDRKNGSCILPSCQQSIEHARPVQHIK